MSSILFRAGLFAAAGALLLICSCEKHYVGEYPQVQRDRLLEAKHRASPAATASPTMTPVDFFPEKKSP